MFIEAFEGSKRHSSQGLPYALGRHHLLDALDRIWQNGENPP